MILWLDAHLSPDTAKWITANYGIAAYALRDLGLRQATDKAIFEAAQTAGVVVMTKDADFAELAERKGPPPQVILLTCGNTSNARLQQLLANRLPLVMELLEKGEAFVEIGDAVEGS